MRVRLLQLRNTMAKTMSTLFVALAALAAAVSARAVPPTSPTSAVGPSDADPSDAMAMMDAVDPNRFCALVAAGRIRRRPELSVRRGVVKPRPFRNQRPKLEEESVDMIADPLDCE